MDLLEEKVGLDRYQTIPAAVMESLMNGGEASSAADANAKNKGSKAVELECPFDKCSAHTTVESRPMSRPSGLYSIYFFSQ